MPTRRASKGGETIGGQFFKGGQFIPADVLARAAKAEKPGGRLSKFFRRGGTRVDGIEEIIRRLSKLPDKIQRRVLRSAVQKSGTIVKKAAQKLAPKGTGTTHDGRPRQPLHKTITRTRAKFYPKSGTVLVAVGPEKNQAPHDHLVHEGTKPHGITLTKPLVFRNVVLPPGFVISHPGAKADPYLAKAVSQTRAQVIKKMENDIAAGIEKEVRKLRSAA